MGVASAHFRVATPPGSAVCVVKATGEVDIYSGPNLHDVLYEALAAGPTTLIIDLAEVTFLDSTGLSVIINALRRAQDSGCELLLEAPTPRVVRLLELTGLHRVLQIVSAPPDGD